MGEFQDRPTACFQHVTALGNEILGYNRPANWGAKIPGKNLLFDTTLCTSKPKISIRSIINPKQRQTKKPGRVNKWREAAIKRNLSSHCKLLVKSWKWPKKLLFWGKPLHTDSVPTDSSRMEGRNTNQPSGFLQYLFDQVRKVLILLIKILILTTISREEHVL